MKVQKRITGFEHGEIKTESSSFYSTFEKPIWAGWTPVDVPNGDEDVGAGSHMEAAQHVVLDGAPDQDRRLRVQPHRLVDHPRGEAQLLDVLQLWRPVPNHCVNLHKIRNKVASQCLTQQTFVRARWRITCTQDLHAQRGLPRRTCLSL